MSAFVDTSALFALLDSDDENHARAAAAWREMLENGEAFVTTNYVLVETAALTQARLGVEAVRALETNVVPILRVCWIDADRHRAAVNALLTAGRRQLSLVDCASFGAMRELGISRAFTFDRDFAEQGCQLLP